MRSMARALLAHGLVDRRWLAVLVAITGCASELPRPAFVRQRTSDLVEVPFPPPPARPEWVPAQPREDAVWIDGEWSFGTRVWSWRYGRWVVPPRGARYSPWTTVRGHDGSLWFAPGTWRDAAGSPIAPPRALARGRATEENVVEDDGILEETGDNLLASPRARGGSATEGCPPRR
jgi:hypothetical protein